MSIVDDSNLPGRLATILRKRPEDRTPMEQAVVDGYDAKYGPGGAEKVAEVSDVERGATSKQAVAKVCISNGGTEKCDGGSRGRRCPLCNPSGKI